jgi:hypothetical protein
LSSLAFSQAQANCLSLGEINSSQLVVFVLSLSMVKSLPEMNHPDVVCFVRVLTAQVTDAADFSRMNTLFDN